MVESTGLPVPVINAERCVHAIASIASCTRCADACPQQALLLTEISLAFDEDRCTGCGHCRPACRQSAISFPSLSFSPVIDKESRDAFLGCSVALPEQGEGIVPCLHAVTELDLTQLANGGTSRLHLARGQCESCAHRAVTTVDAQVGAVNLMQAARAMAPITLVEETPQSWRGQVNAASTQGRKLDNGRRALFSGLLRQQQPARSEPAAVANLARFAPDIDAGTCTGCDACVRICPHGAIALSSDERGPAYMITPQVCTGCGLCIDLCVSDAVKIVPFAETKTPRVALVERRCTRCGVPFHEPMREGVQTGGHQRCRICKGQRQAARLFEVRE